MDIKELKAKVYDLLAQRQMIEAEIQRLNQEIVKEIENAKNGNERNKKVGGAD